MVLDKRRAARGAAAVAGACVCAASGAARADEADYALIAAADTIVVTDERRSSSLDEAEGYAQSRPGGVEIIPSEAFARRYAVTLRDTLAFSAGVAAQPRFGEEVRLSIRGSGLAQSVHLRGVELLFNGVPINGADGFGDFQELDPLFASHLTVSRGANAFGAGGTSLGGAIEFEGFTEESAPSLYHARLEGGSFGTSRAHARAAGNIGGVKALVAGVWQRQDGFRDHAEQGNYRLYADFGVDWNDRISTEAGVLVNEVNQEISSTLPLTIALSTPESAAPAAVAGDFARDISSERAFMKTRADLGGAGALVVGGGYTSRRLFHPVPVIVEQDVRDWVLFARYEGEREVFGRRAAMTVGGRYRGGDTDARIFLNFGGAPGPLIGDADQAASSLEAHIEGRIEIVPDVDLIAGVNLSRAVRDFEDQRNPLREDRIVFKDAVPRFGVLWRAGEQSQVFANVSANYEPPTFSDLTQGGLLNFVPLKAQSGWTFEAGVRRKSDHGFYELVYYHSRLDGEFVAFTTDPLIPAPIFNADDTIHQGVEAAAGFELDIGGVTVSPRATYTLNLFRFDQDRIFGDNRLAGLHKHIGRAEIAFGKGGVRIAPGVQFQTGAGFADYANTLAAPGFAIFGVEASAKLSDRFSLYLDARNLADRKIISTWGVVADARTAPSLSLFTPGEGFGVFAGLTIDFGNAR